MNHLKPSSHIGAVSCVIKDLDGEATVQQIQEFTNIAYTGHKTLNNKQITKAIENGIYRGYFVQQDDVLRIAPEEVYRQRQYYIASDKKPLKNVKKQIVTKPVTAPVNDNVHLILMGLFALGGVVLGYLL